MKKILSVVCSAVLFLSLCACGGKDAAPFDPGDAVALLSSGAFTEALTEIDQGTACALYGIDEDTVTGCAVYGSTGATAEELAIFTFDSADAADAAKTALTYRVEDRREELSDYLPGEMGKLDGAVVEVRGASTLLVVADDYGPIDDYLEG